MGDRDRFWSALDVGHLGRLDVSFIILLGLELHLLKLIPHEWLSCSLQLFPLVHVQVESSLLGYWAIILFWRIIRYPNMEAFYSSSRVKCMLIRVNDNSIFTIVAPLCKLSLDLHLQLVVVFL